ncbi:hypothetical protein SAMN02745671_02260 [Anaerovibrio lipolyticus DSM 3074]|uniref:Apea-like HEPN domain-containing protein n=1 Tax=Anaerovibrio lipolyticus DSM 3074 TaxID=1120997 RepID=A0A1M6FFL7_9FIRM|nr:hypothetical protein [Anaerovibrio lipolyticus]SHI96524.1 hypothetical protein SAMN02745671_02260 [Anaerovibrio lipolyticus DSM 3074]
MRFDIVGRCNNEYNYDGILYCAQRIEEMLMMYTSHLYKSPVYNTLLLFYEFFNVYNTVEKKSLDKAHLNNVLDEFIFTFESDVVIREHFTAENIQYFKNRLKGSSAFEQQRTMHYLFHVMKDYPNWCVETLKKAVAEPKEKKRIERSVRSYIPMIIGMGYHPHFIYHKCKKEFTKPDINYLDAMEAFLGTFHGVDNEYIVYFIVSKRVEKFKTILEERLHISFEQDAFSERLCHDVQKDVQKQICVHISEEALDPNVAAQKAYDAFDLFMRYYRFLGNRDETWLGRGCLVVDSNGDCTYTHIGSERYFYSKDYDDKTLGRNSERIITQLIKSAGRNDFFKFEKVIHAHNTALSSQDINSAFLNLWSIMEIVGVDGLGGETSKIKQVLDNVIPVLKRNYVNKVFEELHDYLKGNLSSEQYNELITSITEDGSEVFKIACLVSLDKYKESRKKAYEFLRDYPLIRSRISQLHEDVFKKKKKFLAELNRYAQRLIWHIQRLYRVRNAIIHSGERGEYMVSLVEHLHSYVDELILDMIDRMTRPQSLGTVANVLLDAQVFIENIDKTYTSEEELSVNDIKLLLR